ncbi:hypothetical protein [Kitasatospora sp. NPDC090308]|uniref:hypothetical protein n=1 Tax=Kitasatospora sp. NPDC090308 TaxID=3364082 RepID=UPI00381A3935
MVVLCLGMVAGYVLGGLLTARAVFRRERNRFLRAGGTRAVADERRIGTFERQERQQAEAFALCSGALWPVALPVLLLHRLVGTVALDRGRAGHAGDALRPDPLEVAARIDELERELLLGPYPGPGPGPAGAQDRPGDVLPSGTLPLSDVLPLSGPRGHAGAARARSARSV